jgi:glycosyltransferase involved in cell wall biosynthesis
MHVHVFAIDILPSQTVVSTGGGLRSFQIVNGLRKQGFDVTYSVPRMTDLARENWESLTEEERKNAFSWDAGHTYDDIIGRLKPEVVVCLWPNLYTFPRFRSEGPIIVYDVNGLQNVEGALSYIAGGDIGVSLQELTKRYLNKLLTGDILLCGSVEQKAYWSGLLSFHLDSFTVPDMVRIPYYPAEEPILGPYDAGEPTFFCTGSFLPWNSPEGHLLAAASMLRQAGRGEMLVVGKPNANMTHASTVNRELEALRAFDFVHLKDGIPYPQLSSLINNRGIAIDLNTRTLEREFAIPIRTVTYLAHGVPVITNDFSVISHEVETYKAGWCVDPTNPSKFAALFNEVLGTPLDQLRTMSKNARRLAKERFESNDGFTTLKERLISKCHKRVSASAPIPKRSMPVRSDLRPCVLVISEDYENFLELRVRIPFDAMYKMGYIKGYHLFNGGKIIRSVGVTADIGKIDAVWVQRAPQRSGLFITDTFDGRFVYDIDDNLLGAPAHRPQFSAEYCTLVRSLLRASGAVTTTSARLTATLQRVSGVQIEHKAVIAPNVTDKVELLSGKPEPDALLIASSDYLPLTVSMQPFLRAIQTFTRSKDLPIVYIGSPVNDLSKLGIQVYATGMLGYDSYREYIRRHNLMAVAPLEGWGDPQTQDFINSKSDIKMVEFGSAGVPAVYADVAPYRETPLKAGPLVDMRDEKALVTNLENVYSNTDQWRAQGSRSVAAHRMANDVVGSTWFRAVQNVRLNVPFELSDLLGRYERYSKFLQEWAVPKEMFVEADYLGQNTDLRAKISDNGQSAYEHYLSEGLASGRTWFPGSMANAHELMLRIREDVLREDQSLKALELRVTQAIQTRASKTEREEANSVPSVEHAPVNAVPATRGSYWKSLRLKMRVRNKKYPPLFDPKYYVEQNHDVKITGIDPYLHYILHGISERRNPNEYFDVNWYLIAYPEADKNGLDPLDHYMRDGAKRGFDPGPNFSTASYLRLYPEVEKSGMNPLQHFLQTGRFNGYVATTSHSLSVRAN